MSFLGNLFGKKEEPQTFGQQSEQSGFMGQMTGQPQEEKKPWWKFWGGNKPKPKKTKKTKTKKPKKQTKYKRH